MDHSAGEVERLALRGNKTHVGGYYEESSGAVRLPLGMLTHGKGGSEEDQEAAGQRYCFEKLAVRGTQGCVDHDPVSVALIEDF